MHIQTWGGSSLVTSLVSLATVCFIILEQSSHIRALQETVADQIEDTDSKCEDIVHE